MKKELRIYLQKTIDAKNKRATELKDRIKTATTADEVRSLGDTLDEVLTELEDAKAQLAELDDEGDDGNSGDDGDNSRAQVPANAEFRGGTPFAAFATNKRSDDNVDRHDTPEYRHAFMEYVCRGVEIPHELRADAVTGVADASA
ncbi:MAG TPA: hypothetical protein DGE19_01245, partial [Coprococcus sp.]|nr:hypothetical protein [Coprococcus sp.]